jgi:alpha-tubulin suppressor-like RCC1 family protein
VFEKSLSKSLYDFIIQMSKDGISVMSIECGDAHLLCSTNIQKLYAWGYNDYY